MSYVKSAMRTAKETAKLINPHYALTTKNAYEIRESTGGQLDAIHYAFIFGYAQGAKAEKATRAKEGARV